MQYAKEGGSRSLWLNVGTDTKADVLTDRPSACLTTSSSKCQAHKMATYAIELPRGYFGLAQDNFRVLQTKHKLIN